MDEKGIELQEINTNKDTYIFSNNTNIGINSTNIFLNQKSDNNKNNNDTKKISSTNEDEEKKNWDFFSFFSCLKYLDIIRERKLNVQVGIVYTFLIIIFIIFIGTIKIYQMNYLFETQADKNYYQSIVTEMIDIQREVKIQLDTINNDQYISTLFENLYFIKMYIDELISYGNFNENMFNNLSFFDNYYDILGDNFKLNPPLNQLMNKIQSSELKNLIPFYYFLSPVIYQNFLTQGIPIINLYYISYINNESDICSNYVYFKFPLEEGDKGSDSVPKNDNIYDYILDPLFECLNYSETIINKTINWYYYAKNYKDPKIINLIKMNENNQREHYLMYFYNFNITLKNQNYSFTISMKILKNNMSWPYIKLNENNDTDNYDYFSLINFHEDLNHIDIDLYKDKKIYKYDYDIDDSNTFIINIPKFIENIYKYSMIPNSLFDSSDTEYDININSLLLKYNEMDSLKDNYNINYYFKKDFRFFELITFLNKFLLYRKKYSDDEETKENHPCNLKNFDEYYQFINEYYNCFNDYCFYNKCTLQSKLFIPPEKLKFMPNCYCIPLYCGDNFTLQNQFHKDMIKKLNLKNIEEKESLKYYTYNNQDLTNETNDSIDNLYFNNNENFFKCNIPFYHKNKNNSSFNVKINLNDLSYDNNINMLLFFFMSNHDIDYIIEQFKIKVNYTKISIYAIYFLLLVIVSAILIFFILKQVNKLIERMGKIKEIRSSIISNGNIENTKTINKKKNIKNNINREKLNKQHVKQSMESLINKNVESESLNNNLKIIENDTNKVNIREIDELDALIKLINDNLADFKIEFNVNENMNDSINEIKKQYNEITKVNEYKNKLIPKKEEFTIENIKNETNSSIDTNKNLNIKNFNFFKNEKIRVTEGQNENSNNILKNDDDLSLKIFYELLSLSTSEIDFSNIKTNFYYRDINVPSLLNFEGIINRLNEDDISGNGEITNQEKLQNAINYYYNKIHCYWKKEYDLQKKQDES